MELGLRRLAERLNHRRMVAGLTLGLCASLLAFGLPDPAWAAEPSRAESRAIIRSVMEADDFGERRTESRWKYIGNNQEQDQQFPWPLQWLIDVMEGFLQGFALFGELLLWLLVGAAAAYLFHWFLRNRGLLSGEAKRRGEGAAYPVMLAGLDIRPETLPADIAAEADSLLRQGEHSITTVCFDSGFRHPSYFARKFRELYGMLPSDFQARQCG